MLIKPNIKNMLGLSFEILSRNSVTSLTRLKLVNQIGGHQFYHVYISYRFHSRMLVQSKDLSAVECKMMHK